MKAYSLVLALFITLSSSSAHAQDNNENIETKSIVILPQPNEVLPKYDLEIVTDIQEIEAISVIFSDIKMYRNFVGNVDNIDLLFPIKYKTAKV